MEQIPFPVSWSSPTSADILTCWAEYPPGGMRSLCFKTVPGHHSPDMQTQTIAQHFITEDFLHTSIMVWKPFSLQQLSQWLLLQWRHEDRNNTSCRPSITCLFARWPKVDLFPQTHCCPSYLVGPSTEDIISVRHQVLSLAQRSFSLSFEQKTRDFRAAYSGSRYRP